MSRAFFVRIGCSLLCLLSLSFTAQGAPQRVRTSMAPVLTPAHTSEDGYLEVTGRSVWVPVANISRSLQVGQLTPMLQRNQDFYIGLFLYDDGYAEMFAVPRILSDGSGSAWVTQEHELMFGRRTETRAGRFFFSPTEFLPIIDETDTEYVVTCSRFGRTFPLRVSKQLTGIRRVPELPSHVAAAMESKDRSVLLASGRTQREKPPTDTPAPPHTNFHGLDERRPDDPDFVDPYPEPVLAMSRPGSPAEADDPFMPLDLARAPVAEIAQPAEPPPPSTPASPSDAAEPEAPAREPPAPPRVVRRHVIDNLSQDLRVEFQSPSAPREDAADSVAQAPTAPASRTAPLSSTELLAGPAIEFLPPADAQQVAQAEPAPSPAPAEPAAEPAAKTAPSTDLDRAHAPSPFDDLPAPVKQEPPVEIASAEDPQEEAPAELDDETVSVASASAAESLQEKAGTEAEAEDDKTDTLLAEASETEIAPEQMEAQIETAAVEPGETVSTLVAVAMNLLILFALLTVGFVVIVIALALFMNRRKTKRRAAASPPEVPNADSGTAAGAAPGGSPMETPASPAADSDSASSFSESFDEEYAQPGAEEDSGTFTGSLESFSVPELIQFLNSSRETGLLSIEPDNDDVTCKLYFERGEIIDALSSRHTGEQAVSQILSMRDGLFAFTRQQEIETHRTVRQSTMALLLQVQPFDDSSPVSVP